MSTVLTWIVIVVCALAGAWITSLWTGRHYLYGLYVSTGFAAGLLVGVVLSALVSRFWSRRKRG